MPSMSAAVYSYMGPRWGLLTLGLIIGLLYMRFYGTGAGWIWLVQWIAMGPIFMVAMKRARTLEGAAGVTVAATVGLQIILLTMKSVEVGMSPLTFVEKNIEASIQNALLAYGEVGVVPQELSLPQSPASALARFMVLIVPGSVIAMDLLFYWWTLLIHRRIMGLYGMKGLGPRLLGIWRLPFPLIWVTILGGGLIILPVGGVGWVGINLLIVMGTLHFFQGVGVISMLFQKKGVPSVIKGLIYFLICFQQVLLLGVIILGLFDIWFDFRKRWMPLSVDN
jgi:uncharacterized protein YybS (DUF2232 family)